MLAECATVCLDEGIKDNGRGKEGIKEWING
jgi:hypothetical protein